MPNPEYSITVSRSGRLDDPDINYEDEKPQMVLMITDKKALSLLTELTPEGFERLCQRVLREFGFENVVLTGRSGRWRHRRSRRIAR